MTKSEANKLVGGLSNPSKMPCKSYGLDPKKCKVGSKLRTVENSTCSKCYACKGMYVFPSVQNAFVRRLDSMSDLGAWVENMICAIGKDPYFRWHDAGDIQSMDHLLSIVSIAEAMPSTRFWIPTRENGIVRQYMMERGEFPENLCVRLSATMIDGEPSAYADNTSSVHKDFAHYGDACQAYRTSKNGAQISDESFHALPKGHGLDLGHCGNCRKCWDKAVVNVSYGLH